jgi:hypothetical protein
MARYVAALLAGGEGEHGSISEPETLASMYAGRTSCGPSGWPSVMLSTPGIRQGWQTFISLLAPVDTQRFMAAFLARLGIITPIESR